MIATRKTRTTRPPAPGLLQWLGALVRDNVVTTVLAMIIAVPLITGSGLLNDRGKVAVFEALGGLLLLLVVGRMRVQKTRLRETLLAGPNLPLALLAVLCLVSCAVSPFKAFAWQETMRVGLCLLLYFVMVGSLRGQGHLQTLTDGLLLVTAAVTLLSFAQMGEGILRVSNDNRLQGTFGSHELLGSFLLLMLPLSLALGLTDRGDTKRQLAAQSVALLTAACLLMARARFAWVGSAVSLVALSVLALRYCTLPRALQPGTSGTLQQMRQRRHLIVGPLLILSGALALFILLSSSGTAIQSWAGTIPHAENMGVRLTMWKATLRMIADRPLFGWGIGSYPIREYTYTGLGDPASVVLRHGTSHSNIAHNFYLQTAAELGLVGLGLYLAAMAAFFVVGVRALGTLNNGLRKAVLLGCLAAMAGQAVDAIGSPAYNFAAVSLFQWVLMGLGMFAAGLGARAPMSTLSRAEDAAPGVSRPLLRGLQYGFAGLIALGIVSQIVPTMPAAFAQTCDIGNHSFVVQGLQGQDTGYGISRGMTVPLVGYYDGSPASGTTFVISGSTRLVSTTTYSGPRFDVTRNMVSGTGSVTVTATYNDGTSTYTNAFVINLR